MDDNDLRSKIVDVWTAMLGAPPDSDDENFFELGGHSVLAMRFVWLLRERYAIELPLRDFLEDASVAGIARALESGVQPT
jgi:acyl carrier protein